MKKNIKRIITAAALLILVILLLKNNIVLKKQSSSVKAYKSELAFYKLKAQADSLLTLEEFELAFEISETLDSITNTELYTTRILTKLEERNASNNNFSKLSDKLQKRSSVIQQLKVNKNELIDSLERIKTTLETLQLEYDSIIIFNSHISQKVNELNDSIGAISPMDALTIRNADGVTIRYIGEIKDDKAHGIGYAIFDSKSFYEGQWENSFRSGKGKYYWPNGDRYDGAYANDLRNGQGTYHFSSGEQYIGHWKDDLRHGSGVLLCKDGKVLFEGMWKDNEPIKKPVLE